MREAKALTGLRICAGSSELLLLADAISTNQNHSPTLIFTASIGGGIQFGGNNHCLHYSIRMRSGSCNTWMGSEK